MPVTSGDFLTFARGISLDSEIGVRNAVSRAYYAMYSHAAEKYGDACKMDKSLPKKGGCHVRMANYINQALPAVSEYSQEECSRLSLELSKIKGMRHHADYHLDKSLSVEDASVCIESAERFMLLINE